MMRMSSLVAGCSDRAPDVDVKPAPDEERRRPANGTITPFVAETAAPL